VGIGSIVGGAVGGWVAAPVGAVFASQLAMSRHKRIKIKKVFLIIIFSLIVARKIKALSRKQGFGS
jgi:hypothetical protein